MEQSLSSIGITILSNIVLSILGIFYLTFRRPLKYSGTYYLHSSFSKSVQMTYFASDSEILNSGNQDSFFYLSFMKYLSYLLLLYTSLGLLGLIPIYNNQTIPKSSGLSQFSIETMNNNDIDLLVPAICSIIFSLGIYFLAFIYYKLPYIYPHYFPKVLT